MTITDQLLFDVADCLAVSSVAGLVRPTARTVLNHHETTRTKQWSLIDRVASSPAVYTAHRMQSLRVTGILK